MIETTTEINETVARSVHHTVTELEPTERELVLEQLARVVRQRQTTERVLEVATDLVLTGLMGVRYLGVLEERLTELETQIAALLEELDDLDADDQDDEDEDDEDDEDGWCCCDEDEDEPAQGSDPSIPAEALQQFVDYFRGFTPHSAVTVLLPAYFDRDR